MNIRNFEIFRKYVSENKGNKLRRCLVRCDLNLPSDIEDLSRVYLIKDTILELLDLGIKVSLISHYKRPSREKISNSEFSLKNIVLAISKVLEKKVEFVESSIFDIDPKTINSDIVLLENLRFYEGETKNNDELAKRLAQFGDVYINEAFSVSHRKHASIDAITRYLPSFAGLSFQKEIERLSQVISNIEKPFTAIIGGSKVSSKIGVLKRISQTADYLIITGAMANTFLVAKGTDMKNSIFEIEQLDTAKEITKTSKAEIVLPIDFLASQDIKNSGTNFDYEKIPNGFSCFDIGERSTENIIKIIDRSKTVLWNGAIGAFEFSNFNKATGIITKEIAKRTKNNNLISVIGGGETIASIGEYKKDMTFVSTAGGAFLEFVAGYELPGIAALQN
ncbi:MAG: phosphoglycerate kinase [Holosporales bacterium]|jgi:phosphoglycerate kinase|nr:phosphoglycerate kinase [Holosporales bacterium]